MKKTLLFLLLVFTAFSQAQIVNIPDANFKAKLLSANPNNNIAYGSAGNYVKIDANNDGNIQLAEAMAIDSLDVSYSHISDMTGIAGFANLKKLNCSYNQVASLDASVMPQLKILDCSGNAIDTLNFLGMAALEYLNCSDNQLTNMATFGLTALKSMACGHNPLGTLDVSPSVNLEWLACNNAGLTALNVSGLSGLTTLYCDENQLAALDVSTLSGLIVLTCNENDLTHLDVTGLQNLWLLVCENNALASIAIGDLQGLRHLYVTGNQLTGELDLTGCPMLESVNLENNLLVALDVSGLQHLTNISAMNMLAFENGTLERINASGCTSLNVVYAASNSLAELNLSGCPALNTLYASDNQLTTLDLSDSPSLTAIYIDENQLETLFVKNGGNESILFVGNPNLRFVCADEAQIPAIQQALTTSGMTSAMVSSYCSFAPGGLYNTVTGNVRLDAEGNGCSAQDPVLGLVRIGVDAPPSEGAVFTNTSGSFTFYSQVLHTTLTPSLENPDYFNVSPASQVVNFTAIDGSVHTVNFCLTPNGSHPDLEVVIVPLDQARPGFDAHYDLLYRNKGNQTVSGQLNFGFEDSLSDFVTASQTPDAIAAGSLTFNYADLQPFERRNVQITINVNSPMDIPAVNINDVLHFTAAINSNLAPDETPSDNNMVFDQVVVGPFDPNAKHCLEGATINPSEIGKYLHYVINFENTGTVAAENVVVKDVIDTAKFEIASLQMLSASHPVDAKITGDKVEFIFQNIDLGAGEHGHVVFKIKTKSTLAANSSVSNKADIFFDYNFPVTTDPAVTTFQLLATKDFESDHSVVLYPNPAGQTVEIRSDSAVRSIQLFDAGGRILSTQIGAVKSMDISACAPGVYYLRIVTETGAKTEKLIKK